MNPSIISKQFEQIKKEAIVDKDNAFCREVQIIFKGELENVNIMIDKFFTFEIDENWLYVRYNNQGMETQFYYSHTFALSLIASITDEV